MSTSYDVYRYGKLAFVVTVDTGGVCICSPDGVDVTQRLASLDRGVEVLLEVVETLSIWYRLRAHIYSLAVSAVDSSAELSYDFFEGGATLRTLVKLETGVNRLWSYLQAAIASLKWALHCRVKPSQSQSSNTGALAS